LHALRVIKSQAEINVIKQSIEITKEAFLNVAKDLRPGKKEYEIEAELTYHFLRKGASGHAFHPIVASGKNACFLHYIENNQECKDGDLLLMDFGAEYLNYASDCSRTLPVNGKFTERQKEIYQSVLSVFKYARGLMKPGTTINKFHHKVCEKLEQEHLKLGLYTHEDIKAQDPASPMWFKYYMHGTSHFMGLDVHDVGSKDQEFVPGMVLTCEPGIYIPEEGIGIRLENDILITPDGNEDLMADIPIEPDDIESLMNTNNL
jgi:Xaa-Pro aminopeptidase